MDYHGIIINLSLKDKSYLRTLEIIGRKNVFLTWLVLYKVSIPPQNIDTTICNLQSNLVEHFGFYSPHFYAHFYRDDELIIVFKDRVFRVKTDPATWQEVLAYGRAAGIPEKQLDFSPCQVEDESY